MKKQQVLSILLCLTISLALFSSAGVLAATQLYTGEAQGFGGPVQVEVRVEDGVITDVTVTAHSETQGVGSNAIDILPGRIVQSQSVNLDAVSGCTVSSKAILEAVASALAQSSLDMDKLNVAPAAQAGEDRVLDTDVVVVGAGLAGLSAAIKARESGAQVILVEKMSYTGGNSRLSTGVFLLGGTDIQKAAGIEDDKDGFYNFIMEKSGGKRDPAQVSFIAERGNEAMNWIISLGVDISDSVGTVVGCTIPRAHQSVPDATTTLSAMTQSAERAGIELLLNTPANGLTTDETGAVTGITATAEDGGKLTINAQAVVLASGGFAADPQMLKKYWNMDNVGYAGVPGTTGEMTEAAIALGADTMDIDVPWMMPSMEPNVNSVITTLIIANGSIMLTSDGHRFCDEAYSYAATTEAVFATGEDFVYEIFDEHVREAVYKVDEYIAMGCVTQADTIEELAEKMGLPIDAVVETVAAYNAAVRADQEDEFGRTSFAQECNKAPFYCVTVKPGTIMSPGGLKIDGQCQVMRIDGSPIEGLYAAGEITGGYRAYGYIGGDSCAQALVSGMIAGESAGALVLQQSLAA